MARWILTLVVIAAVYWYYHREPTPITTPTTPAATEPALLREPGRGLNPFVIDSDHAAPPQRP